MASDQRADDAQSIVFDTAPLDQPIEILGATEVVLDVASNRPVAMIAARLVDVAPDGAATLVSYGLFNLCHHQGHDRVMRLTPGESVRVTISLNHVGYAFPRGHRIRLSLSSTYWPIVWPSPEFVQLTVLLGDAYVTLPERRGLQGEETRIPSHEPVTLEGLRQHVFRPSGYGRKIVNDMDLGEVTVIATKDMGRWRIADVDLECDGITTEQYTVRPDEPLSARMEVNSLNAMARGNWRAEARARTLVRCTASEFGLDLDLDAFESSRRIFHRSWRFAVPREGI